MSSIRIFLGIGVYQSNFEDIYKKYWDKSISSETTQVIFDLKIVEWINTEEIAFLFSWIRLLKSTGKTIRVILPYTYDIFVGVVLKTSEERNEVLRFYNIDTKKKIERRKNRNLFLLSVWELYDQFKEIVEFENIIDGYNSKVDSIKDKYNHQIIPYTIIDAVKPQIQFENSFDEFESGERIKVSDSIKTPFQIGRDIIQILKNFNCYSPFESKIISNIITKELFLNSLLHSNLSNKYNKPECYFALSLNNKWDYTGSENLQTNLLKRRIMIQLIFIKTSKLYKAKFKIKLKVII